MRIWSGRACRVAWALAWMVASIIPAITTRAEAPQGEPRFLIESVEVEGLQRTPERIIVSEARLVTGHEYLESELREAVYRINRLPFVIDSHFSLRKGSVRGAYVLVIEVNEAERFFFGLDLTASAEEISDSNYTVASAGARQFVGTTGVLFGNVVSTSYDGFSDHGEAVTVGYSQYDLFDRPLSLTLSGTGSTEGDSQSYEMGLGWQLPHSQSLSLRLRHRRSSYTYRSLIPPDYTQSVPVTSTTRGSLAILEWRRDTTDDLLFPTRGQLINAQLVAGHDAIEHEGDFDPFGFVSRSDGLSLTTTWGGYRPLTERQTLGVLASLSGGTSKARINPSELGSSRSETVRGEIAVVHALDIWRSSRRSGLRDLRWQSTVDISGEHTSYTASSSSSRTYNPVNLYITSSLDLRNRWGVFRIGLVYGYELREAF